MKNLDLLLINLNRNNAIENLQLLSEQLNEYFIFFATHWNETEKAQKTRIIKENMQNLSLMFLYVELLLNVLEASKAIMGGWNACNEVKFFRFEK